MKHMFEFLKRFVKTPHPVQPSTRRTGDVCPPKDISVQEAARMVVDQYGEALIKLKDL